MSVRTLIHLVAGVGLVLAPGGCSSENDAGNGSDAAAGEAPVAADAIEASLDAGHQYLAAGNVEAARLIAEKLAQRAPRADRARELLAQVRLAQAIEAGQAALPDQARLRYREAYQEYRAASALRPDSAGLHQSAGTAAMVAGLGDEALAHFVNAARLEPAVARHPLLAAQVLIQQGRHAEADKHLVRCLQIDPDLAHAHASRAVVAMEEQRFDDAMAHMAQARRLAPRDLDVRVLEARLHRRRGQPRLAVDLLAPLPEDTRGAATVTEELAAALTALGEHSRAAQAWATHYQQHAAQPGSWLAAVRAGESLVRAGEFGQARTWLTRARLAAPDAPEVHALEDLLSR